MWKERGTGRLRMLERALKAADGVGRLRRSKAAIVCERFRDHALHKMEKEMLTLVP